MPTPKDYWNKRLARIDIDNFDFSISKHDSSLDSFCGMYLGRGDPVLDLGCGGGRNSRYLAMKGYQIYGVDFSELAVDFCQKVFRKLKLKGSFYHCDLDRITFADNSFSGVICIAVLDHLTVKSAQKTISEIRRVLKSGKPMLLTFDPIDRIELFNGVFETLPDGTLKYLSGDNAGMIFRKYSDDEIIKLIGNDKIISFGKDNNGTRVVTTL